MTAKWGIANIYASYNNIMITLTDITGAETLAKVTGGMIVKQAKDESSPYAAQKAAERIAEIAAETGFISVTHFANFVRRNAGMTARDIRRGGTGVKSRREP